MDNQNMLVLKNLVMDQDFAREMEHDVDAALANAGIQVDEKFAEQLKSYGKTNGFVNFAESSATDLNDSLTSAFGLESRW